MAADLDRLPAILRTETSAVVPALIVARGQHAGRRFIEFFTANVRNDPLPLNPLSDRQGDGRG